MSVDKVIGILEDWERLPLAIVAMAGPWLTPLVTAYFVAMAIHNYLNAPPVVAVCAGIVLEVVGIAGIANATRAYMWNKTKRKTDKEAPLWLSIGAVAVYFFTALLLTVVLEVWEELAPFAPGMFIILSVSSGLILVLSSIQRRLERDVTLVKEKRKTKRKSSGNGAGNDAPEIPEVSHSTKDRARKILAKTPTIAGAELGRRLGRSERLGRLVKNEILAELSGGNGTSGGEQLPLNGDGLY